MAAEGFALVKHPHMQRALYSLDISYSDPVLYAQALSRSFYNELAQCVHTFYQVFENIQVTYRYTYLHQDIFAQLCVMSRKDAR